MNPEHRLRSAASIGFVLSVILVVGAEGQQAAREDGQWTMPAKHYAATRYSGLREITAANAARLRPVWTFSTGVLGGHEGQPLVVNNTMYVVTPYPNVLYAFDLTEEGYPLHWKYRPDVNPSALGSLLPPPSSLGWGWEGWYSSLLPPPWGRAARGGDSSLLHGEGQRRDGHYYNIDI